MERLGYTLIVTDVRENNLPVDTYWYHTVEAADFLAGELMKECPHLDVWVYYPGIGKEA